MAEIIALKNPEESYPAHVRNCLDFFRFMKKFKKLVRGNIEVGVFFPEFRLPMFFDSGMCFTPEDVRFCDDMTISPQARRIANGYFGDPLFTEILRVDRYYKALISSMSYDHTKTSEERQHLLYRYCNYWLHIFDAYSNRSESSFRNFGDAHKSFLYQQFLAFCPHCANLMSNTELGRGSWGGAYELEMSYTGAPFEEVGAVNLVTCERCRNQSLWSRESHGIQLCGIQ